MKKVALLILSIGLGVSLNSQAQLYAPEIKVQGTETKVVSSNGGYTYLRGDRLYVYPGEGSRTELRGSAILLKRNHSICGAQLQFLRQNSTDWTIKNSEDDCGNPGGLHFLNTGRVTRMTILQNGNVGIGDANPQYKLNVQGQIACNGTLIHSDERLKRDIKDYSTGLALVKQVQVKKYKYKAPSNAFTPNPDEDEFYEGEPAKKQIKPEVDAFYNQDQIGVVAQELQLIAPHLVGSYTNENGEESLTVNHTALTFILINAVKEQQTLIEALNARIAVLEKKK